MSDNRNKVTIEFDIADLTIIADALMIGRNTAMMYSNKVAEKRMERLREMFETLAPKEAQYFGRHDFTELCIALRGAKVWDVEFESKWGYFDCIIVTIDDKKWKTDCRDIKRGDGKLEEIVEFMEEFAPLSAERLLKEEAGNAWGI